jgi:hypothetical protein
MNTCHIIWINGAFGSGKTVCAAELSRRLPSSYIYDPENIGFFLKNNTPSETGRRYNDFQDNPLWRYFNYDILYDIAHTYNGTLIVPMTIIRADYYNELISRLRGNGIRVDHYILGADRKTLVHRQMSRLDFSGSWAAKKLDACIDAFAGFFDGYIDTSHMTVEMTAEHIAKLSGLELMPDRRPAVVRRFQRLITQLRHIR